MSAKRSLRWLKHPQLFLAVVLACLVVGALGSVARSKALPAIASGPKPALSQTQKTAVNCAAAPCLALTFDDGPQPFNTPALLDILRQEHVHATFFVVGTRVRGNAAILQRMHAEGHEIGNHSWSHPDLTTLAPSDVRAQINTTQMAVLESGVPAPRLLRPPYGSANAVVEAQALTIVRWNIDPEDWVYENPDELAARIVQQAKPGGILLLHDTHQHTVQAVQRALPQLKATYQLVTVSELLELSGGTQGQYFGR